MPIWRAFRFCGNSFFTRLVTEKMNKNELQSQIDNLKLEFTDAVYSVVAMKVGRGDAKGCTERTGSEADHKRGIGKRSHVYTNLV